MKYAIIIAGFLMAVLLAGCTAGAIQGEAGVQSQQQSPQAVQAAGQQLPGQNQQFGGAPAVQDVFLTVTGKGYDKSEITVKKGVPVRLHFTAINAGCGSRLVIYGLNVQVSSNGQEAVAEFTPQDEGAYEYNCGMKMFQPGRFVVTG